MGFAATWEKIFTWGPLSNSGATAFRKEMGGHHRKAGSAIGIPATFKKASGDGQGPPATMAGGDGEDRGPELRV